jgi:cell division inhibitor SepF
MSRFFKRTLSFLGLAEDDSSDYENKEYGESSPDYVKDLDKSTHDSDESKLNRNYYKEDTFRRGIDTTKTRRLLSLEIAKEGKKTRVSIAEPHEFEEVQMIGDNFKENIPVIINLQNTNQDLSKRIIDFCSGLTYALGGSIKKVADRVFLITPQNTLVTSNEKEILREKGLYNQL